MKNQKLYFVAGCPRSATSAFSWALAEHEKLMTSAESNFLFYFLKNEQIPTKQSSSVLYNAYETAKQVEDGWFNKHNVSQENLLEYVGRGLTEMYCETCNTDIFLEQSPENILIADKLITMFPDTKIIHMIRDGREVVNSMLKSGFASPWSRDFNLACETWNHYVNKGYEFSQKYPHNILNVYQKDLVFDTENAVKKVFEFLKLDYEENTVKYLQTKRVNSSYGNDEKNDFKTPKDPSLLKRPQWESWSDTEKKQFYKIAGETMKKVGLI